MINTGGAACCYVTHKVHIVVVSEPDLYNSNTVVDRRALYIHTIFKQMVKVEFSCECFPSVVDLAG